jgi:hypothetical protein
MTYGNGEQAQNIVDRLEDPSRCIDGALQKNNKLGLRVYYCGEFLVFAISSY